MAWTWDTMMIPTAMSNGTGGIRGGQTQNEIKILSQALLSLRLYRLAT